MKLNALFPLPILILALTSCHQAFDVGDAVSVAALDDPSLYREYDLADDPLEQVAETIRPKIDPLKNGGPYKEEFVEVIQSLADRYREFWKWIPPESSRLVDLDGDGVDELFVLSRGMNERAWGWRDFIAVLRRKIDASGEATERWELARLSVFEDNPSLHVHGQEWSVSVCDLDRDGRPEVLATYMFIGGSNCDHVLRVLTMGGDGTVKNSELHSLRPIEVLNPGSLRPAFVERHEDAWREGDRHAAVKARGLRRSYHRWTSGSGFHEY